MTKINDIKYMIFLFAICFALSSCAWTGSAKTQGAGAEIDGINVSQEIEEYINKFVSLYTGNVMDSDEEAGETFPALIIEESDYPANSDNGALLVKYNDREGKLLRYQLCLYGETGNTIVDYYFCEHFVWIHRQDNHYSSAILKAGYYDILYSEVEDYILMGEDVYALHDDKTVEKLEDPDKADAIEETEGGLSGIPLPEELEQKTGESGLSNGSTENVTSRIRPAKAYEREADIYMRCGEYGLAAEVLRDGAEAAEDNELAERFAYLKENLILAKTERYRNKQFLQEMSWQYAYDAHGNEVKNLYYSQKGQMWSGWEREYGEDGELTKCIRYQDGAMRYQEEYGYDENGRTLWFTYRYNDELTEYHEEYDYREEYDYDENGDKIEERYYDKDGELLYRNTYEHAYGGSLSKQITYDKYGKEEYQYDWLGNVTKHIGYGADGEIDHWEEWQYNDKGEPIKYVSYDAGGQVETHREYEYQCDAAGNVIQYTEFEIYEGERRIVLRFKNAYDNEGREVRSIEYKGEDILSRTEIHYGSDKAEPDKAEHDNAEHDNAEHDNAYYRKETTYFYQDGKVDYWTEKTYDQRGYTLKYATYRNDGSLASLRETEYDEKGVRRKNTMYDGDGSIIEWYEYNEAGHATKELVYDAYKNFVKWDEYQYDLYGNCVHIDCFDEDGNVVKQEDKTYDALGNLTSHTFHTSDEEIVYTHINGYRLMGTWQAVSKKN